MAPIDALLADPNTNTVDHIVHLTPPGTVGQVSEDFRKIGFHVLPGGTHSDGLTANALVILADGAYLELISFTHPPEYYKKGTPERTKRDAHRWAQKAPGFIDFAFLGTGTRLPSISETINRRAKEEGSGVSYIPEVDGGRVRPDGAVLEWLISSVQEQESIGILPFFCGDVTTRELRVPINPPSNVEHPSTATGVAHIRVLVSEHSYTTYQRQLTTVIGHQPAQISPRETKWSLDRPIALEGGHSSPQLLLSVPSNREEEQFFESSRGQFHHSVYEIGIFVRNLADSPEEVSTPYGKIRFVERK
ncbi:hypothetical protein FA15DRAFT_676689 [Coprinopsis marcescibilis]|uniref:Glyoxalase-like domain-containing protein n=1 Tax=Coprinopsis marcescibilis TaxID=230819 RepID=A0A5C3K8N5_COPMA|nr:hypothetical protein FA15DRAFT_676689 [Coprinopsis marcescibilis]